MDRFTTVKGAPFLADRPERGGSNPRSDAEPVAYTLRKNGRYVLQGQEMTSFMSFSWPSIGRRRSYRDPSF